MEIQNCGVISRFFFLCRKIDMDKKKRFEEARASILEEVALHFPPLKYSCGLCPKEYDDKYSVKRIIKHEECMKGKKRKRAKFTTCNKSFNKTYAWKRHMKKQTS